ncbi:MAG: FliA/WhiG family RNA polymerase sigma factor [Opitutales bacterium]|nr:FliA/WhiG family RNA polymerase sigma factor [Opitutales bacterium]
MTDDTHTPKPPPSASLLAKRAYGKTAGGPDWSLLEKFLPLVKSIVGRMRIYFPNTVDVQDLYSIGITGLVTAVQRCDPTKPESFASYAALRIRGALLDELRRMDWMPRSSRAQAKKVKSTVEELEQTLKRAATEEEIAGALQLSVHQYRGLLDEIRPVTLISMDTPLDDDASGGGMIHEVISDDTEPDARDTCEKREMIQILKDRIKLLPDIPKKVLTMYYFEGMRLAEIAEIFNVTESRICQIHSQAILSLKGYLERIQNS